MKKQINTNKRLKTIILISMIFIISYFIVAIFSTNEHARHQYRMFSDIESMDILLPYIVENIEEDKYLQDIKPVKKFCNKIKWQNNTYDVYAYVFFNSNECREYVNNRTKRNIEKEKSFLMYGNIFFSTEYVIYNENSLLFINGTSANTMYEFLDFIEQNFDVEF